MNLPVDVGWAEWILNTGLRILLVSALSVFVLRLLRNKSAPLRSAVCLLALASLCLLILPPFSNSGNTILSFSAGSLSRISSLDENFGSSERAFPSTAGGSGELQSKNGPGRDTLEKPSVSFVPSLLVRGIDLFGMIWGLGFVIFLLQIGWGAASVRRIKKAAFPVRDIRLLRLFRSAAGMSDLIRVELLESSQVRVPQVFGIRNPVILLPRDFSRSLSDGEILGIFIHELSHVQHRDTAVGLFQRLALAVNWWNPLVKRISCELSCAREEVSDTQVLLRGDSREYARCLIHLAERSGFRRDIPASSSLASSHLPLTERVQKILSKERKMDTMLKKPTRILVALSAVLCVGLAVSSRLTFAVSDISGSGQEIRVVWNEPEKTTDPVPKLIQKRDPVYPAEAVKAGIQGMVMLGGRTDTEGRVTEVEILSTNNNDLLKDAAVQAVLGWMFEPVQQEGGSPVVVFGAGFDFKLENGQPAVTINYRAFMDSGPAVRATGEIKPPKLIKMVEPVYPEEARTEGVKGVVILEVTTDIYGRVQRVKILRSIPLLDKAAIDAVRQWVYEPAVIDGKPRGVIVTITVNFVGEDKKSIVGGIMGGVEGGVTGGVSGGVIGGVQGEAGEMTSLESTTYQAGDAKVVIGPAEGGKTPKIMKLVHPRYPEIARQAKVKGTVVLELSTDVFGRVQRIRVLSSIPLLDKAVIDAAGQWIFVPLIVDGKPQPAVLKVDVTF
ncbi:MAG: M56 family metallopeptidase [Acidobacteria bacterium]|nr:M56 family metallopeptidase [Acidobacteriota bacterium]